MKQNTIGKRIMALLLILVMTIMLLPIQALATENDSIDQLKSTIAPDEENNYNGYIVQLKPSLARSLLSASDPKSELDVISAENNLYLADSIEQIETTVSQSAIKFIEPNYEMQLLDSKVNDSLYVSGAQWSLDAMKVPAAWGKDQYGQGVTVAVIDSGLYGINGGESHEDIDSNKVVKPYNFVDKNGDVTDTRGHGTNVSGILFAKTNNGIGVAGVMPEVRIMPLKVFGSNGAETADVISAIDYAVNNGADVINLSLGSKNESQSLKEACDAAVAKGVLVVAAAGNDGTRTPFYPAAFDSVIGVAALDKGNIRYENSQYGDSVYVSAPGANIVCIENKLNGYSAQSGTSMASPQVAALGAMAKSINKNITQAEFKQLIQQTSTDLGEKGFDIFYGCGAINFEAAANKLLGTEVQQHTYGSWKSNGETTHSHTCIDPECNHKETQLHTWDSGMKEEGFITYTCTACGETIKNSNPISNVWEYELIDGGKAVKLTKYLGTQAEIIVPNSLEVNGEKLPVTTIGNATFQESNVLRVEFPDSITTVEDGSASPTGGIVGTFAFCKNLTIVKLSPKMKKVADYMFYGAGSNCRLELTIPSGVAEIGDSAFCMCNSIMELTLPESLKKIGNSAFYQSRRLATLNMPGVTTIKSDAFTETVFEETYEKLWKEGKFEGIVYAGKVAYLYFGPYCGSGSSGYKPSIMPENTELVLKDGTLGISEFLFQNHYIDLQSCKNHLKSITAPETIKEIPEKLFDGYQAVKESGFTGLDLHGFSGSYTEKYAVAYDNIRFKSIAKGTEPVCNYEWYDKPQEKGLYIINTAEDLWGFADILNIGQNNFKDATVKIGKDIDLGGLTASGYGISSNQWVALKGFQGTLDGQGHTISGIYVNSSQDNQGFFENLTSTCTLKDLHLKGKVSGGDYVGGLVGKSFGATISGCSFDGMVTGGHQYGYIGGIVGHASGNVINCKVSGSVISNLNSINDIQLTGATGGIVGYAINCIIEKCENNAAVNGNAFSIGGIAGHMFMMSKISDCINNGSVNGMQFVGGIAGRVTVQGERLVVHCVNNGSIRGTTYVGGIMGTMVGYGASAEECANHGSVEGKSYASGILGYSEASRIRKCYNTGNITASYSAAGIIAKDCGFGVEDSYNLGNITAIENYSGGITAFATNAEGEGSMINCYNMGKVIAASGSDPLGNVFNNGEIFKNCYYLADKESTLLHCTAKTMGSFTNGEVAYQLGNSYGQTIGSDSHPVFRTEKNVVLTDGFNYYNEGQKPSHTHKFGAWISDGEKNHKHTCGCGETETAAHTWDGGIVTKAATETATGIRTYTCTACSAVKTEVIPVKNDTVRIGTLAELQAFATDVDGGSNYSGKKVLLMADIDASSLSWNPVGYYTNKDDFKDFAGTFDGQGNTITINATGLTTSYLGFMAVNSGTIRNLTIDGNISAKSYVGGICGLNKGSIEGCINKATISASSSNVGGITGNCASNSSVKNCANKGIILTDGSMYVGGIAGQAVTPTEISDCCNFGDISGTKGYVGGIVGYALGNVQNCYNAGTITSTVTNSKSIGGIAGQLAGGGNIKNCYNTGTITNPNSAGIVGTGTAPKLSNNYYLSGSAKYDVCSLSTTKGEKSVDEMKAVDFVTTLGSAFKVDYRGESALKGGYPILVWQRIHEHSYGEWVSDGAVNHKRICDCGDAQTKPHTWDDGTVSKLATETETGIKTFTCNACGATRIDIIPKLPSSQSEETGKRGGKHASNNNPSDTNLNTNNQKTVEPTNPISKPVAVVSNGVANSLISTSDASKIIDEAIKNKAKEVVVAPAIEKEDLNNTKKVIVEIPKSIISDTAAKTTVDVRIETPVANVTLSKHMISEIAKENGSKVTVSAEKNPEGTVSVMLKVDDKVIRNGNSNMRVSVLVEKPVAGTVAMLVKEDGTKEIIRKSILEGNHMLISLQGSATIKITENKKEFSDVPSQSWAKDAIDFAVARELFNGTTEKNFSPNEGMTRGMLVTVLHRLENTPKGENISFEDVDPSKYYAEAVAWASKDIIKGDEKGNFEPNRDITREQLVVIIYNYMKASGVNVTTGGDTSKFSDEKQISSWATDAMKYAVESGLISGKGNNTLDPKGNATRAEVAAVCQKMIERTL